MATPDLTSTVAVDIEGSYVDWSAIFAGAVSALAVSFVLLSFGSAVGLSAVSPWTSSSRSITALGIGSAFWILLVNLWAFALAGYLAARLRHRHKGALASEVEFRDGSHGMLAWATAVVIAALASVVLTSGSSVTVSTNGGDNFGGRASIVYASVDKLLRAPAVAPVAGEVRSEVGRVLLTGAGRDPIAAPDRSYLADVVIARAKVDRPTAEQRVDAAVTELKTAIDRARKAGIVLGFLLAATLLIGGATAWWAAGVGGKHRDEGTVWYGLSRHQFAGTR